MPKNVEHAIHVIEEVKKVIIGKDACIQQVMTAILADGHVLLEDVPGVGKTEMALAFSKAMGLRQKRIQFTPDVLPADITGFSMYQKETGQFVYQAGAVMCNLLLADEINRTSPKTQSALLEVMEEGNVTVDGVTREVPRPFIVLATQNPVGSSGTQRLPESQMDRFMICISIGYPGMDHEIQMLKNRRMGDPLRDVNEVMSTAELLQMRLEVDDIFVQDVVYQYLVGLVNATRNHEYIELGISPRGTLALARMSKAAAFLQGRDFVMPDDVEAVFTDVAIHRIRLNTKARVAHMTETDVLRDIMQKIVKPKPETPVV